MLHNEVITMTTILTAKGTTISTDIVDGNLILRFSNGAIITVKPSLLHESIIAEAVLHGLKQKLVDAAAIARDTDTGRSATVAEKYDAVKVVFDRITDDMEPAWNSVREGGSPTGGLLLRALVKFNDGKKTVDTIRAWLETLNATQKTALRKNAKIAAIIAELQAAKPEIAKIDTDALLDSMM